MPVTNDTPFKCRPFPLASVRLLAGPFRQAFELNRTYLRSLEPDRLLHTFRVNAGLPSSAKPLGGWESPEGELRGHCLGHYLSGCALTAAASNDDELRQRAVTVVGKLAKCQQALGGGFLSAWPESFIDRVEACERVWAPYYTLHKILAGLYDVHVHLGHAEALDVAVRLAGWVKRRVDKLSDEQMQRMLVATEEGGMNEVLANLHALTGDPALLALAQRFVDRAYLEPLTRREDRLKGQHANSLIPNVVGFARLYELTGNERFREASAYFWDQVISTRCYATGGTSNDERWLGEPNRLADQLGVETHETCCTYNLLRLTRHLFTWTGRARYADYYERALHNGILSTIDPASGMTMYYAAMQPGLYKTFGTPLDSFWCCTGTGMESHAKYGDSIYFQDDRGVYVNQFIASELTWRDKGLRLRQDTTFPERGETTLMFSLEKPTPLALRLRVPGWATTGVRVSVNGLPQVIRASASSYATLDRVWHDGDRVEMVLPMSFRVQRLPDDPHLASIHYGPIVLAGQLGRQGLLDEKVYGCYGPAAYPVSAPDIVGASDDPSVWLKRQEDGSLTFRTAGVGRPYDPVLKPFHQTFERYTVYWYMGNESEWRERRERLERLAQRPAATRQPVDVVEVGNAASESAHDLQGENTESGDYLQRRWRQATRGGWFSYRMKVAPDTPMAVLASYWGADAGGRLFDIQIDGKTIASETLEHKSPGQFVDVEYAVPAELTHGREHVTVRFQAHAPRRIAGGVFGLAMLPTTQGTPGT